MKNACLRNLVLSLLAAVVAPVAFAKQTLVAEYIVPYDEEDNWNSPNKIFYGYNTETKKGFTFMLVKPDNTSFYNYNLSGNLADQHYALGYWIKPEATGVFLPQSYTRSITSSGSPSHRYIYQVHNIKDKVSGGYTRDYRPTKEIEFISWGWEIPSDILEAYVITNKLDSSKTDPYDNKTKASYVQCIHTDYVYTVTFKANGGIGEDYTQYNITNSANLVANRFSRTGYSFESWNEKADGSGKDEYADKAEISPTDDLALYAQWTGNVYTVEFNPNWGGISSGSSSHEVKFGGTYGDMPAASLAGFTHSGWYTAADGGEKKVAGSTVDIPSNHVLYAHYTRNNYNLEIKLGTGIASVGYQIDDGDWKSVTTDSTIKVAYNSKWKAYGVAKEGYVSNTSQENPESDTMGTAGYTFNATAKEKTYTVTYKPGDYISGDEYSVTKYCSETLTLRGKTYSRTGYTQDAWSRKSDGSSRDFALGATYSDHVDISLYPYWKANTYTVMYLKNTSEATGSMTDSVHTYDVAAPLASNQYVRTGYSFAGWSTASSGEVEYRDGESVLNLATSGTVKLYAKWTANEYTVTFDRVFEDATIGGEARNVTRSVAYKDKYGELPDEVAKTGYAFNNWWTQMAGGTKISSTTTMSTPADHSVYAHWTTNKYTIVFYDDKSEYVNEQEDFYYDQPKALLTAQEIGCEKTGCDFKGWATNETDHTIVYGDGATVLNLTAEQNGEYPLFAVFGTALAYVAFDPSTNVVTGAMPVQSIFCGEATPLAKCAYTRTGYGFKGWTKTKGGTLVRYKDEANYEPAPDDAHKTNTLYAVWSPNTYTVTFDANGGTHAPTPLTKDYTYDQKYGTLATVESDEGAAFVGWYTEKTGGELITADSVVAITNDATFYAHWKIAPFELTFDAQGGMFTNGLDTLTIRDRYVNGRPYGEFPVVTNASDKVTFAGWWDTNEFAIATQQLTNSCASLELKTLYARWKTNEVETLVKITFAANGGTGDVTTNCVKGLEIGGAFPSDPTRDGYRFVGWYAGKETGARITKDTVVSGAATYYARWSDKNIESVLGRFDGLAFSTDETGGWYEETDAAKKHEGQNTLRSGNGEESTLTAIVSPGGGTMSVWWAMNGYYSSEKRCDKFEWCSNEGVDSTQTSVHEWTSKDSALAASIYNIGWRYAKHSSSKDSNCAWLSGFSWKPNAVISPIADWTNKLASANLVFETGGTKPWTNAVPLSEGIRTQALKDGEFSWVRTTAKGLGTLSFRWRTDCEHRYADEKTGGSRLTDRLEFRVDGQTTTYFVDGSNDWATVSFAQKAGGAHVYEWRYVKDADTSVGEDRAWLDNIIWQPVADDDGMLFLIQ